MNKCYFIGFFIVKGEKHSPFICAQKIHSEEQNLNFALGAHFRGSHIVRRGSNTSIHFFDY